MKLAKVPHEVILRTVVLIVTWFNMILTSADLNPLPFSEAQVYEGATVGIALVATLWAWWKNNSFTSAAIEADKVKDGIKNG